MRAITIAAASAAILMFSSTTFAQQRGQFGTAAEAKAMLLRAVAAVKADKGKAFDMINKGEGGFQDRDLYPFCFNAGDGKAIAAASPNAKQALGQDVRTLRDATGKLYGLELYAAAQKPEGQITEVSYMFPTPNDPKPVAKVSFVTRTAGIGCGVGYYKALAPTVPREPSDTDDGLLTASQQLKFNADWVALSLRTHAPQQKTWTGYNGLRDHLVGRSLQGQRHGKAERLRGFEVDDCISISNHLPAICGS